MTFFDWWENNRQKTWGQIIVVASVLGMSLQAGGANAFLSPKAVAVLTFICVIITGIAGAGTTKSAYANTTKERVAASAATVAVAEASVAKSMVVAIEATPGEPVRPLSLRAPGSRE